MSIQDVLRELCATVAAALWAVVTVVRRRRRLSGTHVAMNDERRRSLVVTERNQAWADGQRW